MFMLQINKIEIIFVRPATRHFLCITHLQRKGLYNAKNRRKFYCDNFEKHPITDQSGWVIKKSFSYNVNF